MSARGGSGTRMLTFADAAAEVGVSWDTVMRWARSGHFRTFVPPGQTLDAWGKSGPKMLRIMRDDWEAFIRAHLVSGAVTAPAANVVPKPAPVSAAGTDGVSRRKKKGRS